MARTALTVNEITNGGATIIDIQDSFGAANADGHSFANGVDRRTFVAVKNASGAERELTFSMPKTWDGANGNPLLRRAYESSAVGVVAGQFNCELPDGKTKLYGPFRSDRFNQDDASVYLDIDSVASVSVAAFKLPWYDSIGGEASGSEEGGGGAVVMSVVPETIAAAQAIVPEGLEPTFNDHDDTHGWLLPLDSARLRLGWLRNNTGGPLTVLAFGGDQGLSPLSSSSGVTPERMWRSETMADGDEWLLGSWDDRTWAGANTNDTNNTHLWIWSNDAGSTANFDIAWLELSP